MILLVRHGETAPNREGRLLGRSDPGLTPRGRRQSERLASTLADHRPAAVIASPLSRCRDTAEVIAARCGLTVETDDRLVEMDYGEWDQQPLDDIPRDVSRRWRTDPDFRPPGGESLADVAHRMAGWCAEHAVRGETIVAVTHVSPIKAAVAWALDAKPLVAWRLFVDVASITRIGWTEAGGILLGFNERIPEPDD